MADVIVFHHAQGLTDGIKAFADQLRMGGHDVMTPDLYEGATFESLDEGVAHAEQTGFDVITARGIGFADGVAGTFVTLGFSLGALPAQKLAQTFAGVLGAVLCHSAVPLSTFGSEWPGGVALQLHTAKGDEWGDFDDAQELAIEVADAELFAYDTTKHLVADSSLDSYDERIAAQILEHTLTFLERW